MNIYFVLEHVSGRGGVETVMKSVTTELVRLGHRVVVFLPDASDNIEWELTMPEVYYYFKSKVSINNRFELISEKARSFSFYLSNFQPPDIIIGTHVPHTTFYSRMAIGYSPKSKIPVISWLHNPPGTFYDSHLINYADLHFAISQGILSDIKSIVNSDNVYWISNPIIETSQRIEQSSEITFLAISRLENKQKRIDVLLKALSQFTKPWNLRIFGTGPDEEILKNMATNIGIAENVTWEGWRNDPWKEINNATALVLSSDYEGYGLVIGESMARGLPVISSDCHAGPRDLIEPGLNGFLFQPGEVNKLTQCFEKISDLSNHEWRDMSNAALITAKSHSTKKLLHKWKRALIEFIPEDRWNF